MRLHAPTTAGARSGAAQFVRFERRRSVRRAAVVVPQLLDDVAEMFVRDERAAAAITELGGSPGDFGCGKGLVTARTSMAASAGERFDRISEGRGTVRKYEGRAVFAGRIAMSFEPAHRRAAVRAIHYGTLIYGDIATVGDSWTEHPVGSVQYFFGFRVKAA